MKNFIISLFIFFLWAFLGMWWYYSCSLCIVQNKAVSEPDNKNIAIDKITEIPKSNTSSLIINDDSGDIVFTFPNKISIYKDSTSVLIPETAIDLKDSIFSYLNNNQNKELKLIGWYKDGEFTNNIEKQNFGLNRANNFKNILVKFGVNPDKISTIGVKHEFTYTSGKYIGGLELLFKNISESKALEINKGITSKTLYTKFNSRAFIPDNTLQTYTADLKNYLQEYQSKSVKIIGHTDSMGDENDNEIIGRDRATNVMNYFISQGITKSKLKALSKGEMSPISENSTNEGRSKNRRIEIIVN